MWFYIIIGYVVIGIVFGALKLFSNAISRGYTTGHLKKQTFFDLVILFISACVIWPVFVFKIKNL